MKRASKWVVLTLILVLVLCGCSQQSATPSPEPTVTQTQAQAEATPAATAAEQATPEPTEAAPKYAQSPSLDGKGLPDVADRLPKEPKVFSELPPEMLDYQIGTYGGTIRTVSQNPEYSPNVFVMNNEGLLYTPGILGKEITENILKSYELSDDQTTYTFHMREGLKWSDGEPVTTEDVRFAIEDFMLDEKLSPAGAPAWLRSQGKADGTPLALTVVDEYTFKLAFDKPYAGLPIRMAIEGWRGYTELLKPAHFLKNFHYKYADEAKLNEEMVAHSIDPADENALLTLFAAVDVLNNQLCAPRAQNFPHLYPWMITDVKPDGSFLTFERNPYYWKVDTAGNQLPYVDKVTIEIVLDMQMITMKIISGEVDFAYGLFTSLSNMPIYLENAERNGYSVIATQLHNVLVNPILNMTYGDDNWKKVVRQEEFRLAMYQSMNVDEFIETIYFGRGVKVEGEQLQYNPEAAKKTLDDIGMTAGADGMRIGPDGKVFAIPFEVEAYSPEVIDGMELLTQQWKDIGLKADIKTIDGTLKSTRLAANELMGTSVLIHSTLWYYRDWAQAVWAPLWNLWATSSGEKGEEPPEDVKAIYEMLDKLSLQTNEEALVTYAQLKEAVRGTGYILQPCETIGTPFIASSKLRNTTDKCFSIALAYSAEGFWFSE